MSGRRALAALAAGATAAVMAASVLAVKDSVTSSHRLRVAALTEKAKAGLQQAADDHLQSLKDLSRGLESAPPATYDDYREIAVRAAVRAPAFAAMNYIDHRFVETFLYPYGVNRSLEGLDLKTRHDALPAAHRAVSERRPAATDLVPLAQGGEGFLAYTPVRRRDRWEGLVEGALDRDAFASRYVVPTVPPRHDVSLLSETNDKPFFQTGRPTLRFGPQDFYFTVRFADRRWWAVLRPQSPPSPLWPLTLLLAAELALGSFIVWRLLKT